MEPLFIIKSLIRMLGFFENAVAEFAKKTNSEQAAIPYAAIAVLGKRYLQEIEAYIESGDSHPEDALNVLPTDLWDKYGDSETKIQILKQLQLDKLSKIQ